MDGRTSLKYTPGNTSQDLGSKESFDVWRSEEDGCHCRQPDQGSQTDFPVPIPFGCVSVDWLSAWLMGYIFHSPIRPKICPTCAPFDNPACQRAGISYVPAAVNSPYFRLNGSNASLHQHDPPCFTRDLQKFPMSEIS